MTSRTIFGFWQRFRNLDGTPRGRWHPMFYGSLKLARKLHSMAQRYSDVGPIFSGKVSIPKRFHEGESKP